MESAHRVSWQLYRGVIPEGLFVLHHCDTPACVNPNHLFLGTQTDNMRDSQFKMKRPKGEAHKHSRLTLGMVYRIRDDNRSQRVIAKELGISQATVCAVKTLKRWKHVI